MPIVELALHKPNGPTVRTSGLLDSGASLTFVPAAYAEMLEIDWQSLPEIFFHGIATMDHMGHIGELEIGLPAASYGWRAPVVFSSSMVYPGVALGHAGFFEHFEVSFKTAQRSFRVFLR